MTYSHILFNVADGIATITLNRPEARNALSPEMRADLGHSMAEIRERAGEDIQAVILTGAGDASTATTRRSPSASSRNTRAPRKQHAGLAVISLR